MYSMFRKRYPHVKMKQKYFCDIARQFFKNVKESVMEGKIFNFRNQLGFLDIFKETRKLVSNTSDKKIVDFGATILRKKYCTPEQIEAGEHVVYKTGINFLKIRWVKWKIKPDKPYLTTRQLNVRYFSFRPCKPFKLAVGAMSSELDYSQYTKGNLFALSFS